jgi:hypothetical protein
MHPAGYVHPKVLAALAAKIPALLKSAYPT